MYLKNLKCTGGGGGGGGGGVEGSIRSGLNHLVSGHLTTNEIANKNRTLLSINCFEPS